MLQVVKQCNSVTNADSVAESEGHYWLKHGGSKVGLVSAKDITALEQACQEHEQAVFDIDHSTRTLRFSASLASQESRSSAVAALLTEMRAKQSWASLLKWRDELYPIYGSNGELVAMVERAASYTFGIRTFGVHINGIVQGSNGETRMWVAKRSATKQTWPGYLDQIVAGGIGNGMGAGESVIKECSEEAGIPEHLARAAKSAGTVQYFARSELGFLPETQLVYDLELPQGFVPQPADGEVQEFYLWTMDQVVDGVRQGLFKPNCALCVVDFLVRHGYLTPENESDYLEIFDNMHCPLPFPGPILNKM
ncbi:hypothetical protein FB639_003551 [Coemansia asiatica]|nr:hypothetical protein FB639_003551 [Coemansia asiatica]